VTGQRIQNQKEMNKSRPTGKGAGEKRGTHSLRRYHFHPTENRKQRNPAPRGKLFGKKNKNLAQASGMRWINAIRGFAGKRKGRKKGLEI